VYPLAGIRTSNTQLLGTTAGIILTAVVAVAGLAVFIGMVYWADSHPGTGPGEAGYPGTGGRGAGAPDGRSGAGPAEISPGQGHRPWERLEDRHVPEQGHPHGRASSWALVAVVLVAFLLGGIALIAHAWWLLWTCAGIVLLAIPAGKAVGIMDDTIAWGSTPAAVQDEPSRGDQLPRGDGTPGGDGVPRGGRARQGDGVPRGDRAPQGDGIPPGDEIPRGDGAARGDGIPRDGEAPAYTGDSPRRPG
jgi:hypothetical protein